MTVSQTQKIKEKLIRVIENTDDQIFLLSLKSTMDMYKVSKFSEGEKKIIKKSNQSISKFGLISEKDANKKIALCLKGKSE